MIIVNDAVEFYIGLVVFDKLDSREVERLDSKILAKNTKFYPNKKVLLKVKYTTGVKLMVQYRREMVNVEAPVLGVFCAEVSAPQ